MRMRLTQDHPLTKSLQEIEKFMDEKGVRLVFGDYGIIYVVDTKNKKEYQMVDAEDDSSVSQVPSVMEYKLTYETENSTS